MQGNDIGKIIQECLNKPLIKEMCIIDSEKREHVEFARKEIDNLSRVIGYCILFKSSEGIEDYMQIKDKIKQNKFLLIKVMKNLGFIPEEVKFRKKEIFDYIYKNFKEDGYVFHSGNSESIKKKMTYGLEGQASNMEHRNQLLEIEDIYRKYDVFDILGWGAFDVKEYKLGWFYDGNPRSVAYYADSPEWFRYFCGQAEPYERVISKDDRFGYQERNYNKSLKAITTIMDKCKMSEEDRKQVLDFFEKCWEEFKDTKPYLLLVPIKETEKSIDSQQFFIDKYENGDIDKAVIRLLEDVREGNVSYSFNVCCEKSVEPDKLSHVDLSEILPRKEIQEEQQEDLQEGDIQISPKYNMQEVYIGNTGRMFHVKDEEDNKEYYFKPAETKNGEVRPYRAYIQKAAYEIQRIINPENAVKCDVTSLDGMFGAIQEKIEIDEKATKDFVSHYYDKVEKLPPKIINQIMREYLVDFCLCNYDSHSKNFIIDKDGNLRGIDKEQSFRYIKDDYNDDMMFSTNYNEGYNEEPPIYNILFNKIKNGEIPVIHLKRLTETAEKIAGISDEQYREIFREYAHEKTYSPEEEEALLDRIVGRKTEIKQKVRSLQMDLFEGWFKTKKDIIKSKDDAEDRDAI